MKTLKDWITTLNNLPVDLASWLGERTSLVDAWRDCPDQGWRDWLVDRCGGDVSYQAAVEAIWAGHQDAIAAAQKRYADDTAGELGRYRQAIEPARDERDAAVVRAQWVCDEAIEVQNVAFREKHDEYGLINDKGVHDAYVELVAPIRAAFRTKVEAIGADYDEVTAPAWAAFWESTTPQRERYHAAVDEADKARLAALSDLPIPECVMAAWGRYQGDER